MTLAQCKVVQQLSCTGPSLPIETLERGSAIRSAYLVIVSVEDKMIEKVQYFGI